MYIFAKVEKKLRCYEDRINGKDGEVLYISVVRTRVRYNMMDVVTPFPPANANTGTEVSQKQPYTAIVNPVVCNRIVTKIVTDKG
mmetsp:Transcript_58/g.113  ORF Transcript_58/g.113 Transcript_58/m.113 type:complete len:85 (-) Transcript_58:618-872(-)